MYFVHYVALQVTWAGISQDNFFSQFILIATSLGKWDIEKEDVVPLKLAVKNLILIYSLPPLVY